MKSKKTVFYNWTCYWTTCLLNLTNFHFHFSPSHNSDKTQNNILNPSIKKCSTFLFRCKVTESKILTEPLKLNPETQKLTFPENLSLGYTERKTIFTVAFPNSRKFQPLTFFWSILLVNNNVLVKTVQAENFSNAKFYCEFFPPLG
jgi:hypothetical protein